MNPCHFAFACAKISVQDSKGSTSLSRMHGILLISIESIVIGHHD